MPQYLKTVEEYDAAIAGTCVIDFTATWCPPCRFIGPKFEELAKTYEGKDVKFYKVDVDDASDVSAKAGINCMPTFHFYKNGAKVDTMEGADEEGMKTKTAALV